MTRYHVTVESVWRGCRPVYERVCTDTVGDGAQAIASDYAAAYCDSGTVRVVNVNDPDDRACIHRRTFD